MAKQAASPSGPEQFFNYSASDPWSLIPVSWIRTGTVFIAEDDRFYRLARPQPEGWWAEPVPQESVGPAETIALIRRYRLDCQVAAAEVAELEARTGSEPVEHGIREKLSRLEQDRLRLREELIQLCNRHLPKSPDETIDTGRLRKWILVAAAAGFVLALAIGIRTLLTLHPEPRKEALVLLIGCLAVLFLSGGLLALVPTLFAPGSHRGEELLRKLRPSGNIVGCLGLLLLIAIAAIVVYVGASLIAFYSGGVNLR